MCGVALRKESVDRNSKLWANVKLAITSLSARRAWIEIALPYRCAAPAGVALRKESVDRNAKQNYTMLDNLKSLSARRAWIEIILLTPPQIVFACRSPQGERG